VATVPFPDGTTVEAVGIQERRPDKPGREYGFYLDARWRPTWTADVIEWEDVGLPADAEATAEAICKTFRRAKHGARLDPSCAGPPACAGTALPAAPGFRYNPHSQ
jgi:hypothetical protein